MSEVEIEIALIPWEINEASAGLPKAIKQTLLKMRNQDNSLTIAKYILSMKHEINLSDSYRNLMIIVLAKLSKVVNNKQFLDITRDDFVIFLDSYRKPEELDALHKWIGTYNHYLVVISRFFKCLYYPNLPQKERPKPPVIQNIPKLKRK